MSENVCTICYEDFNEDRKQVAMPCCERTGASTKFCFTCIEGICQRRDGIGKCPHCNGVIEIKDNGSVSEGKNKCRMCGTISIVGASTILPEICVLSAM